MKITAIANQKGGCGKTTTAIHLAHLLSEKKFKTLLIDFDPQAHSTISFLPNQEEQTRTIFDCIYPSNKSLKIEQIIHKLNPFLDLAPAGIKLSSLEQILHGKKQREFILREKIQKIKNYDFVIIDCPPQLGFLTINAFLAVNQIIIPVDTSSFSLKGIKQTLDIIKLLKHKINHHIDYKLFLTHFIPQSQFAKQIFTKLAKKYGSALFETQINYSILFKQSLGEQKLIHQFNARAQGAKQYNELANEYLKWCGVKVVGGKAKNAFGKQNEQSFGRGIRLYKNKVEFIFHDLRAAEVYLAGDFNNWDIEQTPLLFNSDKQQWSVKLKLKTGKYQYQYIIDGKSVPDPENPHSKALKNGQIKSVIEV